MSLMDQLTKVVAAQISGPAAQKTGLSESMAAKLAPMAMAVVMNGLKKNASDRPGAEALASALDNHDGGLLDRPEAVADDAVIDDGRRILGHVLGAKREDAERQLASAAGGLDQSQAGALLAMAAPAVLGALGKARREQNLDVSALTDLVKTEGQRAREAAPSELSGFMSMLDADGDGNLSNEAMGIGKRLLGGLFRRR